MTYNRLYNEKDIGSMLKRATELQEASEQDPGRGLSLDELEQIAGELGIDASFLRSAAVELESGDSGSGRTYFFGGPFIADEKCVVEGEVTEEDWEAVVQEMRSVSGGIGKASELGSMREWMNDEDLNYLQVSVGSRGSQTTIHVRDQFRGFAVVAYCVTIPLLMGAMIAVVTANDMSALPALATWVAAVSGVFTLERHLLSKWAVRRGRKAKNLMNRLRQYVTPNESISQKTPEVESERLTERPALLQDEREDEKRSEEIIRKQRVR